MSEEKWDEIKPEDIKENSGDTKNEPWKKDPTMNEINPESITGYQFEDVPEKKPLPKVKITEEQKQMEMDMIEGFLGGSKENHKSDENSINIETQSVKNIKREYKNKCMCNTECKNTDCIFFAKDNFTSITDIIENEVDKRIDRMHKNGELDNRYQKEKKKRLGNNSYLSDILNDIDI